MQSKLWRRLHLVMKWSPIWEILTADSCSMGHHSVVLSDPILYFFFSPQPIIVHKWHSHEASIRHFQAKVDRSSLCCHLTCENPRAIKCYWNGNEHGYLSQEDSEWFSQRLRKKGCAVHLWKKGESTPRLAPWLFIFWGQSRWRNGLDLAKGWAISSHFQVIDNMKVM